MSPFKAGFFVWVCLNEIDRFSAKQSQNLLSRESDLIHFNLECHLRQLNGTTLAPASQGQRFESSRRREGENGDEVKLPFSSPLHPTKQNSKLLFL